MVGLAAAGVDTVGSPPPAGSAEATWLNAGAAEVQPGGTDRAPSEAARLDAADTAAAGEPKAPAPEPVPMFSDDLNIGKPPPKPLVAGPKAFAIDPEDPSIETAEVSIDAVEVVPEARLVPAVIAVLDDVEVEVVSDGSACTAVGVVATAVSGDTAWALVPAGVPAAWATAAAIPAVPEEVVVACGGVNGVTIDAADDAPA